MLAARLSLVPRLSVNVDHVATVRQARRGVHPDPLEAAALAEAGGADGITVHLREDRRHIQDADVRALRRAVTTRLNLEMAATEEMVTIAVEIRPHSAMLVPERRQELTTEGGLDVAGGLVPVREIIRRLAGAGIPVSVFIDAEARQVEAAKAVGASICELHTGPWAHAFGTAGQGAELDRLVQAAALVRATGMQLNAGHALDCRNVGPVAALPGLHELHIGHSIVGRAIMVGMREAVREMKAAMAAGVQA
jgi:pyridoxine 5-phosphate synthase